MGELGFVLAVTLIGWVGLFLYVLRMDMKLREVERREEI
ncbi:MAG: CcmD family protein [Firmicutes bacterium]|nr:CcmD family protein [Dethiobacter sp.]MBS3898324.1 CcmD family protein [Dethiobacter sp.]MCL4462912.1 CcmD family protein [Bacillota bacterium]MCL5992590.1 CcmD family protein [Bacillota bacterium]